MQRQFGRLAAGLTFLTASISVTSHAVSAQDVDTSPISLTDVQAALERPECRNSDLVDAKDLGSHKIVSVDFQFFPGKATFRGHTRTVYTVREQMRIDAEFVRGLYHDLAFAQVPHGIDAYRLTDFAVSAAPDGTIHGSVHVDYQRRASMTGTCYRGWHDWPPYPIFSRCDWITDVNGAHAAGIVHTVATPEIIQDASDDSALNVSLASTYEETERPSELLVNLAGLFTFSIGGKYLNDQYRGQVSDFRASIRARNYGPVKLPAIRQNDPNVEFLIGRPLFEQPQGELQLVLSAMTNPLTPTITQGLRSKIIQAERFFESCVKPETQYQVRAGDTLWHIAKMTYGDGQYYHVVAAANDMIEDPNKTLQPGQTLKLRPYYQLVLPGQTLIQSGDTLWGIAKKTLGNGALYTEFRDAGGKPIADVDRLPTLTAIVTHPHTGKP